MHPSSIKVLLVDDDEDFIRYILSIASSFNTTIETSKSVKDALELIQKRSYDAYLIDLNLPDGSGFELIEAARAGSKAPIASISGVFHDNDTFRKLKEQYAVDYILGKPVFHEQIERLFLMLSSLKEESNVADPKEKLLAYYRGTICDKIDQLSKLISAVQHHADAASLHALKDFLHKIAGSAGTYGFYEVTSHCRKVEHELGSLLESGKGPTKKWTLGLSAFLEQIKYDFQFPSKQSLRNLQQKGSPRGTLFVLDPDTSFLTLLEREKEAFPFSLITESNPDTGKELLLSPDFNPAAVVIAQTLPGFRFSGSELIETMRKKPGYQPTICGILTEQENLELRVRLSEKNIDNFFLKPISPLVLLQRIASQMPSLNPEGFKVLVVDDDEDICRFVQASLEECGINTLTINEPENLFRLLEEFSPDFLILDVLLPKYNGLDLLKTIQADPIYSKIPTLIITFFQEETVKEAGYNTTAVDVMFKPLNKSALQKLVLSHAKDKSRGIEPGKTAFRTGLKGRDVLNKALSQISDENTYLI
ncbi:MAG: response regulator, partial [Chlamydiia bacterium]|nr:response regulator [Chlamydiia bacterium]